MHMRTSQAWNCSAMSAKHLLQAHQHHWSWNCAACLSMFSRCIATLWSQTAAVQQIQALQPQGRITRQYDRPLTHEQFTTAPMAKHAASGLGRNASKCAAKNKPLLQRKMRHVMCQTIEPQCNAHDGKRTDSSLPYNPPSHYAVCCRGRAASMLQRTTKTAESGGSSSCSWLQPLQSRNSNLLQSEQSSSSSPMH